MENLAKIHLYLGESGEDGESGENPPAFGRIWTPGTKAFAQQVGEGTTRSMGFVLDGGTAQLSLTDEKRHSMGEDPTLGRKGGSSPSVSPNPGMAKLREKALFEANFPKQRRHSEDPTRHLENSYV